LLAVRPLALDFIKQNFKFVEGSRPLQISLRTPEAHPARFSFCRHTFPEQLSRGDYNGPEQLRVVRSRGNSFGRLPYDLTVVWREGVANWKRL